MNRLLERVEQSIVTRKLFRRGQRLLVAVSGGVDSMVLLHLLHHLAPKQDWRITVAHFNHQLRGRSSDADERLVRQTAKQLGLPFVAGQADVRRLARRRKLSIEMAARKLRHDFLARAARRRKISTVVQAHHADDQVELFFLRLLRGSGTEGLVGMREIAPSPADWGIIVARPLLGVAKSELEKIARENNIRFREDASNCSSDFLRNRIRRELLPLLRKKYQPALEKTILRVMDIIGAESNFVTAAAHFSEEAFDDMHCALQRRIVQRQLQQLGMSPDHDFIEQLRKRADVPIAVSDHLTVVRDAAGKLYLERRTRSAGPQRKGLVCQFGSRRSGAVTFAGATIQWKIERQKAFRCPKRTPGREFFDAEKVGGCIVLRHWRAGDRFQPIGMKAAVKLQDLFVNAKIPRQRRHDLVVATTAAGELFWVEGLRMGEQFKLSSLTKRWLRWEWERGRD